MTVFWKNAKQPQNTVNLKKAKNKSIEIEKLDKKKRWKVLTVLASFSSRASS